MTEGLSVRLAGTRGETRFDMAFEAPLPGTVALFGASGAGKSTALAAIAGLWRPDVARIAIGGVVLQDETRFVPPEKRGLATVFQDARLFPHLSVAGNLRYGARRVRKGGDTRRATIDFDATVALLGLEALLARRPATLSGGERQRVAIGRALLARPRMLLMDEPLASLDAPRKACILAALGRLRARFELSILLVTHAPDEVAALADTLVLLEGGQVVAAGCAAAIAASPDLPLARRRDAAALLRAVVVAHDEEAGLTEARAGAARLLLPLIAHAAPGRMLRLRIPAREVILAATPPGAISLHNVLAATVTTLAPPDGRRELVVALRLEGGATLLARITEDAARRLGLTPGRPILALVKSTSIEVAAMEETA